jgi:hypothetical protein
MGHRLLFLLWETQRLYGFLHGLAELLEFQRFFFGAYPENPGGFRLRKTAEDLKSQGKRLCLRGRFPSHF